MENRIRLQKELEYILGSRNVYYQPPESIKLKYPAIIYSRSDIDNTFADNNVYKQDYAYEVTVIDYDPDSDIVKKMSLFPKTNFNRHFTSNNLNHDVFTTYY